ncbi:hypothetical protein TrCOL_g9505, partial [Triparma columacea]
MCKFLGLFSFGGQELCQGRIKVLNKNGLGATNKGKFSLKGNKSLKGLNLDVKTAKAIAAVVDGSICKVERLDEILQAAQVTGGNKLEVKQRFKFLQLQHWGWGKKNYRGLNWNIAASGRQKISISLMESTRVECEDYGVVYKNVKLAYLPGAKKRGRVESLPILKLKELHDAQTGISLTQEERKKAVKVVDEFLKDKAIVWDESGGGGGDHDNFNKESEAFVKLVEQGPIMNVEQAAKPPTSENNSEEDHTKDRVRVGGFRGSTWKTPTTKSPPQRQFSPTRNITSKSRQSTVKPKNTVKVNNKTSATRRSPRRSPRRSINSELGGESEDKDEQDTKNTESSEDDVTDEPNNQTSARRRSSRRLNNSELVNAEKKPLEDGMTEFNRRRIKAMDGDDQKGYVKMFVLGKKKKGGKAAARVAKILKKSTVDKKKGERQLLLFNPKKNREEAVGRPFYKYAKLHSTKEKKGKSKGDDENADEDAVASGSTLVFEGKDLEDALEKIDGLNDLLAEVKISLEAKWGLKEGTLELIDMHALYDLAFRAHQDTNDGEPRRVITAVVNLSEDGKEVPGLRIYNFDDHSYEEQQGTVISFHSHLFHKSLHYKSDNAEEEAGGQQDDHDDTGMKLTFFFGLVGEANEGTTVRGGFLGGRNRKQQLFEALTTTSESINGLGKFESSLGVREQFFFRRLTAKEEDVNKFDSSTLGSLYLLTRSESGAEAKKFDCRIVPEEVARWLLPEFYVHEGKSSSGGVKSNFFIIHNEEGIRKGEEEVSKKKAPESQKAPSSTQSRKPKSTAPETPASRAPLWHCSHCNKYHTLPSAVLHESPHKPFTEEHGFSKREVEKDGDCFYSCIIECLDSDETYKEVMCNEFSRMGEKTPFKNKLTVKFMRELVASKLTETQLEFYKLQEKANPEESWLDFLREGKQRSTRNSSRKKPLVQTVKDLQNYARREGKKYSHSECLWADSFAYEVVSKYFRLDILFIDDETGTGKNPYRVLVRSGGEGERRSIRYVVLFRDDAHFSALMYKKKKEKKGLQDVPARGTFTLKDGEEPDAIRQLWEVEEVGVVKGSLQTLAVEQPSTAEETPAPSAALLFRDLTEKEEELVKQGLEEEGTEGDVVGIIDGNSVTRKNLSTLKPREWLCDEVVNFFYSCLKQRDEEKCESSTGGKRSWFFNSFFLKRLLQGGDYQYERVKTWSKKVPGKDIFELNSLYWPVNIDNQHWIMLKADMIKRKITYYDSKANSDYKGFLKATLRYFKDEWKAKGKPGEFKEKEWTTIQNPVDFPKQENGFDCGIFTCLGADYVSAGWKPDFTERDCAKMRKVITLEILQRRKDKVEVVGVKSVVSSGFLPSYQNNIEPAGKFTKTKEEIRKLVVISDGMGGLVEARFNKPEKGELLRYEDEETKVLIEFVVFKGEEEEGKWTGFWAKLELLEEVQASLEEAAAFHWNAEKIGTTTYKSLSTPSALVQAADDKMQKKVKTEHSTGSSKLTMELYKVDESTIIITHHPDEDEVGGKTIARFTKVQKNMTRVEIVQECLLPKAQKYKEWQDVRPEIQNLQSVASTVLQYAHQPKQLQKVQKMKAKETLTISEGVLELRKVLGGGASFNGVGLEEEGETSHLAGKCLERSRQIMSELQIEGKRALVELKVAVRREKDKAEELRTLEEERGTLREQQKKELFKGKDNNAFDKIAESINK